MHRINVGRGNGDAWRLNRRRVLGVALSGAGAAALAACSKRNGSQVSSSNKSGTPKYGGQLNVALPADPYDFDPTSKPKENSNAIKPAYDSLLSLKTTPDVDAAATVLQPGLAERWEAPDGQTFTFHLTQGVKFANLPPINGRALTSADAKWSVEYISRTGQFKGDKKLFPSLYAGSFDGMDSIQTPDDQTIVLHFSTPLVPFINTMAQFYTPVLAHEIYDQDGNFSNRIVGTGPWQLDLANSRKGVRWIYKRNPDYFRKGRPFIDQINWIVISDDATQMAAFQTKQIDILGADHSPVSNANLAQIERDNPGAIRETAPASKGGIIYINPNKAPLTDIRIRKAMQLALDHGEFVKTFGDGTNLWSAVGETPGYFTQQEYQQMLKFDPAQAKQMVSDAGFANGVDVELINPGSARGQEEVAVIQLFQAQMKKANINIVYHPLDRATEGLRKKGHDFFLDCDSAGSNVDIDDALVNNFYSKASKAYGQVNDPDLDKLILAQRQEPDPTKRRTIIRQAIQRIYDQAWSLSLFFGSEYQYTQPYVKNYKTFTFIDGMSAVDTWLEK